MRRKPKKWALRTSRYPRPSYRPRRRPTVVRRAGAHHTFALGLLGLSGVVALALLMIGQATPERPRTAEMCLQDRELPAIDAVVIDATERLDADRGRRLAGEIARRAAALPVEGKLAIAVVLPNAKGDAHVVFARCKPDDGSGASGWTANPRLLAENYHQTFGQPLQEVLDALPGLGGADSSPLLNTFYAVSTLFEAPAAVKTLMIASDLLEYSASTMSMYRAYSWQSALAIAKVRAMQGRLQDVAVSVLLRIHERSATLQTAKHATFWTTYFKYAGATSVHFTAL